MPFQYSPYRDPYVGSIAELLQAPGRAKARAAMTAGEAQARASEQSGQIWGNALANVGQTIGAIPGQMREARQAADVQEMNRLKLEKARREAVGEKALDEAFVGALKPDGTIDDQRLLSHLPGSVIPSAMQVLAGIKKSDLELQKARQEATARTMEHAAGLLNGVKTSGYDTRVFLQALSNAEQRQLMSRPEALQHAIGAIEQGPGYVRQVVDQYLAQSAEWQKMQTAQMGAETSQRRLEAELPKIGLETEKLQGELAGTLPPNAAQAETARHNQAMEEISRLTAGRQEAGSAETARHNRAMEDIGRTRATGAQVVPSMPSGYQVALNRAIMSVPAVRRGSVVQTVNRLWQEGNEAGLKDAIRQAAIESEPVDTRNQITGRMATLASLRDTRQILQELKASGVPTNWFVGTTEDLARKLGTTQNPQYVILANRLMGTLINYRRAATGVQFSQREQEQYQRMFPNYRNTLPVNLALIDGLEREMQTYDQTYWEHKLGPDGARLIGMTAAPASAQQPSGGAAPLGEWIDLGNGMRVRRKP